MSPHEDNFIGTGVSFFLISCTTKDRVLNVPNYFSSGARGLIVIVVGNRHSDTNSNSRQG